MIRKQRQFVPARIELAESRAELAAARRQIKALEDRLESAEAMRSLEREGGTRHSVKNADLLSGYEEIGSYVGLTARQAKHRALSGTLPTFKMGRLTCATKSGLRAWLAKQMTQAEAAARRTEGR